MPQSHRADRLGDAGGLVLVDRIRACAVITSQNPQRRVHVDPEDQERRLAVLPALGEVGAHRLLAHRVEVEAAHDPAQLGDVRAARQLHLQPGRLAARRATFAPAPCVDGDDREVQAALPGLWSRTAIAFESIRRRRACRTASRVRRPRPSASPGIASRAAREEDPERCPAARRAPRPTRGRRAAPRTGRRATRPMPVPGECDGDRRALPERFEDRVAQVLRHAGPVVLDRDQDAAVLRRRRGARSAGRPPCGGPRSSAGSRRCARPWPGPPRSRRRSASTSTDRPASASRLSTVRRASAPTSVVRYCGATMPRFSRSMSSRSFSRRSSLRAFVARRAEQVLAVGVRRARGAARA